MRLTATRVELLKSNDPSRSKVRQEFSHCVNRIGVIHQNEPTNNRIEAFVESNTAGIVLQKRFPSPCPKLVFEAS
jgi:hypothetical protein